MTHAASLVTAAAAPSAAAAAAAAASTAIVWWPLTPTTVTAIAQLTTSTGRWVGKFVVD